MCVYVHICGCEHKPFIKYIPFLKTLRFRWQRVERLGTVICITCNLYTFCLHSVHLGLSGGNTLGHGTDSIVVMWEGEWLRCSPPAYREHILKRMS